MTQWPADKVERWPIGRLVPYAQNARTHSDAQVDQVAASIREWGWTNPILVGEEGGIIAGHCRVLAARKLGIGELPVMIAAGWTEEQKRAYGLADNQLGLNAGWDIELLRLELGELKDLGFDVGLTGFSIDELRGLSIGVPEGEFPDIPEGERNQFASMTFTVHRSQLTAIEEALRHARERGPFDGPNPNRNGNALTRVCESYLASCGTPATSG